MKKGHNIAETAVSFMAEIKGAKYPVTFNPNDDHYDIIVFDQGLNVIGETATKKQPTQANAELFAKQYAK